MPLQASIARAEQQANHLAASALGGNAQQGFVVGQGSTAWPRAGGRSRDILAEARGAAGTAS
eukprot:1645848-Alexandrium_andersonii.AAC.1